MNIRYKRLYIVSFLIILFASLLKGVVVAEVPEYHTELDARALKNVVGCDTYIITNSNRIYMNFNELQRYYDQEEWDELDRLMKELMIKKYLDQTLNCMTAYKFKGDIDYFFVIRKKLSLLNSIYEYSIERKSHSKSNVSTLSNDIKEYMIKLEGAKKTKLN